MIGRMLIGAALCAGGLLSASGAMAWDDQRNATAQEQRAPFYSNQHNYDYGSSPAFTEGCPAGAIPEPFPNGNGRRCALRGGGYAY
jgi:hypothetical protein